MTIWTVLLWVFYCASFAALLIQFSIFGVKIQIQLYLSLPAFFYLMINPYKNEHATAVLTHRGTSWILFYFRSQYQLEKLLTYILIQQY